MELAKLRKAAFPIICQVLYIQTVVWSPDFWTIKRYAFPVPKPPTEKLRAFCRGRSLELEAEILRVAPELSWRPRKAANWDDRDDIFSKKSNKQLRFGWKMMEGACWGGRIGFGKFSNYYITYYVALWNDFVLIESGDWGARFMSTYHRLRSPRFS